ncbi:MAG: glycosyltransferase [Candidatus Eisenbacteria bacterium]|nr:glycosyltransferase [Candidatus Eisenbacteria bacterium]
MAPARADGERRRLLYIAYFFPPLGGAGVQRTLKFVRYLPEFGWDATVVTGPASYWLRDDSLEGEVPPSVRVVRAPHWGSRFVGGGGRSTRRSASRIRGLRAVSRALLVPDAYVGWTVPARRVLRDLLRVERFDAVITTSSPDSTHLLGRWLHRSQQLPWIADFRDPWTRRMSYAPPTELHHRVQQSLERSVLCEANRVVVTSDATRQDYLQLVPSLRPDSIVTITNGFDEGDFRDATEWMDASGLPNAPLRDCPILHAGQLNPERPLETYLQGLRIFLERNDAAESARTLFLGGHYDADVEKVAEAGLSSMVEFSPSCPHRESVAALLRARVLLLLEQDSERGSLILPGKIFEYFRSGRPILAVVPTDGAAANLVRSLDAGWVADPSRPESVAEGLERLLRPDSAGPRAEVVQRFERRTLAGDLARLLDGVV